MVQLQAEGYIQRKEAGTDASKPKQRVVMQMDKTAKMDTIILTESFNM